MAGTAAEGAPAAPGRSSRLRVVLVIVLVAILASSAVLYVTFAGPPQPRLHPHGLSILVVPVSGNNSTVFRFTGVASDDHDPPSALQVRWDWEDDGTWDTTFSTIPTAEHRYAAAGTYTVRMEVENTAGLRANTTATLMVMPTNLPPHIEGIGASPPTGTNATTFTFTVNVTDDHDPASAVQVRWDWESDGTYDTNWSATKVATHRFPFPGNFTVGVQARDTAGLVSHGSLLVRVSPTAPTLAFRIGTIFSITGALSFFGVAEQNGVAMAVAEINANGGVLRQTIQLFSLDDGTNPSAAAQAATTLVSADHVAAILGSTGSGQCAAILPIAAANHVFEISPSCTSPIFSNLTFTGGWFARTAPSDALQAVVAASYAYGNLSQRRAAVIGINNAYGIATANAFAQNFSRLGGFMTSPPRIVNEIGSGTTDYTADLMAVLNTSPAPQIVYVVAYPPDGVVMMRDWWNGIATNPSWANMNWTFSEGCYDPSFINPLVSSGVNVSRFQGTAPAAYAGLEPAAYAAWAARYQTMFGSPPIVFAANAYDAAFLVALAAQQSGNATGWGVRAGLRTVASPPGTVLGPGQWAAALQEIGAGHDINYNGASGSVDVGAHGDVPSSFIVWGVNATNQLVTLEFFNETLVVSLSPPNTYAAEPVLEGPLAIAVWSRGRSS